VSGHVLVVGGTRGIGRAVVSSQLAAGKTVSVIGRHPPADLPRGVGHWAVDLTDDGGRARALDEIVERHGPLTALVLLQRFRGDGDTWAGELDTSLTATRLTIEACAGRFDAAAAIVIVGSIAGRFVAGEQPVGYHAAKAAMEQMARYYAVTLGPRGIRVNCVSPSTVVKDESAGYYAQHPEIAALYSRVVPLGRMGTAREVAAVVDFFCGAAASFVTGQVLVVDGGVSVLGQEALARRLLLPDERSRL